MTNFLTFKVKISSKNWNSFVNFSCGNRGVPWTTFSSLTSMICVEEAIDPLFLAYRGVILNFFQQTRWTSFENGMEPRVKFLNQGHTETSNSLHQLPFNGKVLPTFWVTFKALEILATEKENVKADIWTVWADLVNLLEVHLIRFYYIPWSKFEWQEIDCNHLSLLIVLLF